MPSKHNSIFQFYKLSMEDVISDTTSDTNNNNNKSIAVQYRLSPIVNCHQKYLMCTIFTRCLSNRQLLASINPYTLLLSLSLRPSLSANFLRKLCKIVWDTLYLVVVSFVAAFYISFNFITPISNVLCVEKQAIFDLSVILPYHLSNIHTNKIYICIAICV